MEKETLRSFILFGVLLLFVSLQIITASFFGVVPNFVLVAVILAALFLRDLWHTILLLSIATFFLKFSPAAGFVIAAFFAIGIGLIFLERILPWHAVINAFVLTVSATMLLYLLVDRMAIPSLMFMQELGYNVVLTYVGYYALLPMRAFHYR